MSGLPEFLSFIDGSAKTINNIVDIIFCAVGLIALFGYPIYFFKRSIKKNSKGETRGEILSQAIILVFIALGFSILWLSPEILTWLIGIFIPAIKYSSWLSTIFRFGFIFLLARAFVYRFLLQDDGKKAWRISFTIHILAVFLGLLSGRWIGFLLLSIPLLSIYYYTLDKLAHVILPASNPESTTERKMRFSVLHAYAWGVPSPIYILDEYEWKVPEPRIQGNITWRYSDFGIPIIEKLFKRPGAVWAQAHQVVAITGGSTFKRIEGPGLFFTGKVERLLQIIDLRLQLRTNEIDVVSKDGISFKARVFTAFRTDRDEWKDKEMYKNIRSQNPLLRGANKLSYEKGSFPFSHLRTQATVGVASIKAVEDEPNLYWHIWVLNLVENQTRKVISQMDLSELWRPLNDKKGANTLDAVAAEMKESLDFTCRTAGILLIVARIVNFRFPTEEDVQTGNIAEQQLATWASDWERKRTMILAEAEAESERIQQEARAYAESLLLNSIAEGLQKVGEIDSRLPRHVIAIRFLSTLQNFVRNQSDTNTGRQSSDVKNLNDEEETSRLYHYIRAWQDDFSSKGGRNSR